ncbi:MAG: esterase/lipase family protein, partial [Jatrophihabitantaceae bacterium]
LGTALDEVAEVARDVHRAIAGRIFGLAGPLARPVQLMHDAIAATAYAAGGLAARTVPAVVGAVAAETGKAGVDAYGDTPRGHFALSALNGFWGDRLAEQRAALAPVLSVRTHDGRLRRLPGNVAHDATDATGRLVIFLHGLCENDRFWWYGAQRSWGDPSVTYGSQLRTERGWTPLYVHYNTGLHVSENGRLLAGYLETLVDRWPVPVTEIALVGHSMGGLVARSASHLAADRDLVWVTALRHIVGLGTPHLGAPLERWVNAGTHALARLPETRPFASWLNRRSVGIKDLRHGAVGEQDWFDIDPDDRADHVTAATLLPGVAYSMVSATLSRRPDGRLAHDLLVEHISAHGTGRPNATRRIEFAVDRLFHVGGRTHFHLLDNRDVYERLRSWLEGADGAAEATAHVTETSA